jgi:RHS repeat-associated protein
VVNGVITDYVLEGGKVILETTGSDTLHYSYDSRGQLVSFSLNGTPYFYTRNGQGDITGLIDASGVEVVRYTYDSWGKPISITGSLATTVGAKNPYRYRGYRYDNESGLYYLQSRYYDPVTSRMLNADNTDVLTATPEDLTDKNLFAYCDNDPINRDDKSGDFWEYSAAGVGALGAGAGISWGAIGGTVLAGLGAITPVGWVVIGTVVVVGGVILYAEHTKGARPSTKGKHEKGQTRKNRDQGGEKGDARRKPNPNKRNPRR